MRTAHLIATARPSDPLVTVAAVHLELLQEYGVPRARDTVLRQLRKLGIEIVRVGAKPYIRKSDMPRIHEMVRPEPGPEHASTAA